MLDAAVAVLKKLMDTELTWIGVIINISISYILDQGQLVTSWDVKGDVDDLHLDFYNFFVLILFKIRQIIPSIRNVYKSTLRGVLQQ